MVLAHSMRKRRHGERHRRSGKSSGTRRDIVRIWNTVYEHNPMGPNSTKFDNQVYRVYQTAELGNLTTSSAGAEVDGAQAFQLSQIQGYTSYTAAFDQYRIDQIEVQMTLSSSTSTIVDNFRWLSVTDYDDISTVSFNGLLQYANVTDCNRNEAVLRVFQPHIAVSTNSGGSGILGKNEPSSWLDSASPSVNHFGVKWALSATSTTVILSMRVRFLLSFRNAI
jgi:hypothetical protein